MGQESEKEDLRLKRVIGTMHKYRYRADALIEVLHVVEEVYGYVPRDILKRVARDMKIPPSKIYGVVTFYHFFSLKPKGEHNCLVCMGTACHVKGSRAVLDAIREKYGIEPGETTPDGKLGLQTARCIGCCSLAPVVIVDERIHPHVRPEDVQALIDAKTRTEKGVAS